MAAITSASFGVLDSSAVSLIARDPETHAIEFEEKRIIVPGLNIFSPPHPIPPDRKLDLEFAVSWTGGQTSRAGAQVKGFQQAKVSQKSHGWVLAKIDHAQSWDEDCELTCLDTGKTSPGPCLDCSDGEHTIRICC